MRRRPVIWRIAVLIWRKARPKSKMNRAKSPRLMPMKIKRESRLGPESASTKKREVKRTLPI